MMNMLPTQVYLNYGALDNMQLLMYYGFTMEANPYDTVTLELEPDEVMSDVLHVLFFAVSQYCA